jgi:hypothetical protein
MQKQETVGDQGLIDAPLLIHDRFLPRLITFDKKNLIKMHPDVHENLREVNSLAASQKNLKKKWNMSG